MNAFHVTGLFPYPLKTLENYWFFNIFRGYRMGPVEGNEHKTPNIMVQKYLKSFKF